MTIGRGSRVLVCGTRHFLPRTLHGAHNRLIHIRSLGALAYLPSPKRLPCAQRDSQVMSPGNICRVCLQAVHLTAFRSYSATSTKTFSREEYQGTWCSGELSCGSTYYTFTEVTCLHWFDFWKPWCCAIIPRAPMCAKELNKILIFGGFRIYASGRLKRLCGQGVGTRN